MRVSVLIVNWRNAIDTIACLESLLLCVWDGFHVIVCDNGSNDGSLEKIAAWLNYRIPGNWEQIKSTGAAFELDYCTGEKPLVTLLDVGENRGFAAGNNAGIRYLLSKDEVTDYFWLLNNDTLVAPDVIAHLVGRMVSDPNIGICGARIIYIDPPDRLQTHGGAIHNKWLGVSKYIGHLSLVDDLANCHKIEAQMDYVCGASMFVSKAFIDSVGLMQEDYFLYFEELDWAERGKIKGFRLGYADKARVWHKEGASAGSNRDTRKTSWIADYYLFRNRLLYTTRFHPIALPTVWLSLLLVGVRRILRGQYSRGWLCAKLLFGWRK